MKKLMKDFQGNEKEVEQILNRISKSNLKENSHLFPEYGSIPIIDAVKECLYNGKIENSYPAIIFLRVVLAANRNYIKHVHYNIENIKKNFPDLKSLKDLNNLINSKSKDEFYKLWGHKNQRKYNVLKNLLKASEKLRLEMNIQDDYNLLKKWAENVNIKKLKEDEIGKIMDVGIATVQHLRMDFGVDTVKPDQRVIEVLETEFVNKNVSPKKAIHLVKKLSELTGVKTREIDLILVNYGSGYYDNRKNNSRNKIQTGIAKKLIRLDVNEKIISEATGISLETIKEFRGIH